ncbi:MAG: NUDIX domain-containing protein [Candidatus Woesearchaeota archaeon]
MPEHEKSAGVIIYRRENKGILFLLLFKKYKTEYWDLAKGHVEKNEDPIETARREAQEEAGITDLEFIPGFEEKVQWWYKLEGKLTKKTVTYYLAETRTKEAKVSLEHIKPGWFTLPEVEKVIKHKDTKELLKKAQKFLEKREKQSLSKFI